MDDPVRSTVRSSHWIAVNVFGVWVGILCARLLFPGAAMAKNPTGVFGWHLVGFSACVGLVLGICQAIYLWGALNLPRPSRLFLWVPLTAASVVVAILPLYWVDAYWLELGAGMIPMLPGMGALGVAQWFVLGAAGHGVSFRWVALTLFGGFVGGTVGMVIFWLIVFLLSWFPLTPVLFPEEAVLAAVILAFIAAVQTPEFYR
jgi:hypothetical protein